MAREIFTDVPNPTFPGSEFFTPGQARLINDGLEFAKYYDQPNSPKADSMKTGADAYVVDVTARALNQRIGSEAIMELIEAKRKAKSPREQLPLATHAYLSIRGQIPTK
jgi:hypothetical protein